MRKPSQCERLVAAMRRGWVTPREAFHICGTLRFSGRVLEIKRAGHRLVERWVETQKGERVKAFKISTL